MAHCIGCYHFDVCEFNDNVLAANNVEDLCPTFKDKSLVLDLPFKVGDKVLVKALCECVHFFTL